MPLILAIKSRLLLVGVVLAVLLLIAPRWSMALLEVPPVGELEFSTKKLNDSINSSRPMLLFCDEIPEEVLSVGDVDEGGGGGPKS